MDGRVPSAGRAEPTSESLTTWICDRHLPPVLTGLGASSDVAPKDLAVAALARGERPADLFPTDLAADAEET